MFWLRWVWFGFAVALSLSCWPIFTIFAFDAIAHSNAISAAVGGIFAVSAVNSSMVATVIFTALREETDARRRRRERESRRFHLG